ncbi:MAG: RNA chaperone Hfq [Acidobacteria bacterium]|nr:RNA chaperone Hfq [Acidobacteriota bacterium]MBV9623230.1 RNA chaperone Hfq [Acidobacteriota bacterium]
MAFFDTARRRSKALPAESTSAEARYLKFLADKQRRILVKLVNGETLRGWIEYYDRNMLRLTREGKPNLFIFKDQIAYLAEEGPHPGQG